ncbi:MAG: hypothetical protein V4436_03730 [Patescibacteria group bacterium]
MSPSEQELSWQVASHTMRERSNDWFWGLGALAIIGSVASIVFGNALLAIIIVLGAFSLGFLSLQQPREHNVVINQRGVSIDGTRYPYKSIRSFWVEHSEHNARLFVSMNGVLAPHFSIYLADTIEGDVVRRYLKRYVLEEEQGPQLGEQLAEIFGLN